MKNALHLLINSAACKHQWITVHFNFFSVSSEISLLQFFFLVSWCKFETILQLCCPPLQTTQKWKWWTTASKMLRKWFDFLVVRLFLCWGPQKSYCNSKTLRVSNGRADSYLSLAVFQILFWLQSLVLCYKSNPTVTITQCSLAVSVGQWVEWDEWDGGKNLHRILRSPNFHTWPEPRCSCQIVALGKLH